MNRWHVYEWLKQFYMASGRIPTTHEINQKFSGNVETGEIFEGLMEFQQLTHISMPVQLQKFGV